MINTEHADIGTSASIDIYGTDRFKSESLSIYFRLPVNKDESIIRSLLLSVLKRGSEKYTTQKEINKKLDELYAAIITLENRKYDKEQLLGLNADIINNRYTEDGEDLLTGTLDVMSQILFHPLFDKDTGWFCEEYVKSEILNYKNLILSQINEPRSYAAIRCREETFASLDLSYKLSEMCENIDKITAQALTDYYKSVVSHAKCEVFYVGERSIEEVSELVRSVLPQVRNAVAASGVGEPKMLENPLSPIEIIEEKEISQSRIVMSVNCGITHYSKEYYAMSLCNEILGSSSISKLMMNVRESLGLCYECSSAYDGARGALFIYSGIDKSNFELAKSAILDQIEAIKKGDISEAEFSAAKKSLLNVYKGIYDSPAAIERFYLGKAVNGIHTDIETAAEKISAITVDEVVSAAKKLCVHTIYFLKGISEGEVFEDECE